MPPADPHLVELMVAARAVLGRFGLRGDFSAGSCAAAIRSADGRIFTGICLDLACGLGFCAEQSAVADMLKARQTRVAAVVAVDSNGIVPPCGRCRELLAQLDLANLNAVVMLPGDRVQPLHELLPQHWLDTG